MDRQTLWHLQNLLEYINQSWMITIYEVFKYIILNMFRVLCNKASAMHKFFFNISI